MDIVLSVLNQPLSFKFARSLQIRSFSRSNTFFLKLRKSYKINDPLDELETINMQDFKE